MHDIQELEARRRTNWGQTATDKISDTLAATKLIERVGIATLYAVSPEIPSLYHAYTGDPTSKADSEWDSDAGHVYSWRWILGRQEAAFYTAIIRSRPTWVSWPLLAAILRLRGELRSIEELYNEGQLSNGAWRISQALTEAGGPLETGALRRLAGFPTGKEQRAAYLRAMNELDTRLLVAKVFAPDDEDMRHALVTIRYPEQVKTALSLSREGALEQLLLAYLPQAVYAIPDVLAKHLGIPEKELRIGLEKVVVSGQAQTMPLPGKSNPGYVWISLTIQPGAFVIPNEGSAK